MKETTIDSIIYSFPITFFGLAYPMFGAVFFLLFTEPFAIGLGLYLMMFSFLPAYAFTYLTLRYLIFPYRVYKKGFLQILMYIMLLASVLFILYAMVHYYRSLTSLAKFEDEIKEVLVYLLYPPSMAWQCWKYLKDFDSKPLDA